MEKHGPEAGQCTVIFDMENFNLRQYMWRPGKKFGNFTDLLDKK